MDNDTSLGGVLDGSLTPLNRATSQPEAGRACTCHPDDNPPVPCPQKYALSECRKPEAIHSCSYHCERPECVRAQRDEMRDRANPWKDAIDNELVVCQLGTADSFATPRDALKAAIDWNCKIALDPDVSSEAQALIDKGKIAMRSRIDALRDDASASQDALVRCLDCAEHWKRMAERAGEPVANADSPEAVARAMFEEQSKNWPVKEPWEELHPETRQIWINHAIRVGKAAQSPAHAASTPADAKLLEDYAQRGEQLTKMRDERDALREQVRVLRSTLDRIALIAHDGGLANLSTSDALTAIRRASLPYFKADASAQAVRAALKETEQK